LNSISKTRGAIICSLRLLRKTLFSVRLPRCAEREAISHRLPKFVKMRVLQVLEATLAGTSRYLDDVAHALGPGDEYGLAYSLHRADSGFTRVLGSLRSAGWRLYELDMQREIDLRRDYRNARALREIYRQFEPDVVHAHASKAGALARLAAMAVAQRPATVYSPHSINATRSLVARGIETLLASGLDILAAVTSSEYAELCALRLVPRGRTRIITPTISSDAIRSADRSAARQRLGIPAAPIVVATGRLVAQKNPLLFVELVARLRAIFPGIQAFWLGDGELNAVTQRHIAANDLNDNCLITGWLDDVRTHLAACDVFVSVAAFESFGYATAEAMAMARPVVASAVTGTVDVVRNDRDLQLFALPDFDRAVAQIAHFLRNPNIAVAVGKTGRDAVLATYSPDKTRRTLIAAYEAAVAHRLSLRTA
jgi:glycosyltransferase involved in cell wall biosynthesis